LLTLDYQGFDKDWEWSLLTVICPPFGG